MAERRGWLTANVVAQLAFGLLSMTICFPSMQDWPAQFGASQAAVQLTFSGFAVTYGGMQLLYGPLSDRIGRKPVLVFGLLLGLVGVAIAAFAQNLPMLIAGRLVQGAGCGASMVMGRALVHDFFEGRERTRVMALVGMTMGFVPPTATLLGGQLHVRVGWQAVFVVLALIGVLLLAAAWRLPPRVHEAPHAGRLRDYAAGYAALAREPSFIWYAMLLAGTTGTFYAFLGGAPLVLRGYGVTPDRLGWYIMGPPIAYIVGNIVTTRLIRTHSEYWIMLAGQLITMAGLVIVLALGVLVPDSALAFSLPFIILGIGHGLLVPPTLSGTVGLVPAVAGSAAAMAGVLQQLGGAVGGYTVGLIPGPGQVDLGLVLFAWSVPGLVALLLMRAAARQGDSRKRA
ncbi:Bcr/CflA family efflux MFS transporter [Ramlibacter albus]|uniref:Bcr/CflA family efflux transporter n=1 Tax=Ramlibacter albus TaxID=2079448 RepID=A0A923M6A8_9BURK|nr:Bcr/CflA family efflux MFS transporter [Ramlibacter albus]MBC5764596.1 Bcr/CflA family efflux MFS transporter [Ramlibacter albus]